jgi:hypothetical protein
MGRGYRLDAKDFEARIAALQISTIESELDLLRNEMEIVAKRSVETVRKFATVGSDRSFRLKGVASADIADAEGHENLRRLNAGFTGLREQARKLIEDWFLPDRFWIHGKQSASGHGDEPLLESRAQGADAITRLSAMTAGLAALLFNVNDLLRGQGLFDDHGPSADFQRLFGGPLQYEDFTDFAKELSASAKQCAELTRRYSMRSHELEAVERVQRSAGDADVRDRS